MGALMVGVAELPLLKPPVMTGAAGFALAVRTRPCGTTAAGTFTIGAGASGGGGSTLRTTAGARSVAVTVGVACGGALNLMGSGVGCGGSYGVASAMY